MSQERGYMPSYAYTIIHLICLVLLEGLCLFPLWMHPLLVILFSCVFPGSLSKIQVCHCLRTHQAVLEVSVT